MFGCVLFAGPSSRCDLQVYEGEKMQFNKRDTVAQILFIFLLCFQNKQNKNLFFFLFRKLIKNLPANGR
jgi:hypothetical protein